MNIHFNWNLFFLNVLFVALNWETWIFIQFLLFWITQQWVDRTISPFFLKTIITLHICVSIKFDKSFDTMYKEKGIAESVAPFFLVFVESFVTLEHGQIPLFFFLHYVYITFTSYKITIKISSKMRNSTRSICHAFRLITTWVTVIFID